MSTSWRDAVAAAAPGCVQLEEPLAPRVAFRIGGPADALVEPTSAEMLASVLRACREHAVPVTVLGTGSNVLISDRGVRGVVLRLRGELSDVHLGPGPTPESGEIEAGAGALNAPLVALALSAGLAGVEFLATIPGTFGGALIMNAGAHGGEIGPFVREVRLIDRELRVVSRPGAECGFAYRTSGFAPGEVLTGAVLVVPRGDARAAKQHLREMREARRRTQPIGEPNAGSIFKNPPGDHAGRLIEAAGLKGRTHGGARISEKHANFIVNAGGATSADVEALAALAQAQVEQRFGVRLEWEVKRLG